MSKCTEDKNTKWIHRNWLDKLRGLKSELIWEDLNPKDSNDAQKINEGMKQKARWTGAKLRCPEWWNYAIWTCMVVVIILILILITYMYHTITMGACCIPTGCEDTKQNECIAMNGIWHQEPCFNDNNRLKCPV